MLTNRLELLFLTVLAFPKASRRGLDCRMMSLTCWVEKNRKQRGFVSYIWHTVEDNKVQQHICWSRTDQMRKHPVCRVYSGKTGHLDVKKLLKWPESTLISVHVHIPHSICTPSSSLSHLTQQPRDRQTDADVLGYPKTITVYNRRLLETLSPDV